MRSSPSQLLRRAQELLAGGDAAAAWALVHEVAEHARATGDAALLADAATSLVGLSSHTPEAGRIHRLCVEALAGLGDGDPVRAQRLRDQRDATRSPWAAAAVAATSAEDPQAQLLALHAEHARLQHVDHVEVRLDVAARALGIAERAGADEPAAWGHLWRILALGQLGRRVELDADVAALGHAVAQLDQPAWWARLDLVRAGQRMLDGRFDECAAAAQRAGGFLGLVMRSQLALLTGADLDAVESEVGVVLDGLPFLARGWQVQLLLALGRRGDAEQLWRALAAHGRTVPTVAPEWLVTVTGHARIAVELGDVEAAGELYEQLVPYRHLHVLAAGEGPYGGPVALDLGRLAALLGDRAGAVRHLGDALASTRTIHALPWVALVRFELARIADPASPTAAEHLAAASGAADRLGMGPLSTLAADLTARRAASRRGPLTPRETEIAARVADGLSNREIARRLHLSERTVENHVSHVLTKLALPSRAAIATWFATSG